MLKPVLGLLAKSSDRIITNRLYLGLPFGVAFLVFLCSSPHHIILPAALGFAAWLVQEHLSLFAHTFCSLSLRVLVISVAVILSCAAPVPSI